MSAIKELMKLSSNSAQPALFIGHGSPMNIIDRNKYTNFLRDLGASLKLPKVILVISAHWLTSGTKVQSSDKPQQIFDFYGFPDELYHVNYSPFGAPDLANEISIIEKNIIPSEDWGLDHGSWSVLHHLFPKQNVPVVQLSIDRRLSPLGHLNLARQLKSLRERGVLVIGSGNLVHNLRQVDFNPEASPLQWALDFESFASEILESDRTSEQKINDIFQSKLISLAHPTLEHLIPLIYAMGLGDDASHGQCLIKGVQNSSVSMASFVWT